MIDLWKENFKPEQIKNTPKSIIEEQCNILNEKTDGLIVAKLVKYDKPILYSKIDSQIDRINKVLKSTKDLTINLQEDLGALYSDNFRYEFYITSKHDLNYKYRVFFLQHTISIYPVELILDQDIADELNLKEYRVKCTEEDSFIKALGEVLNSKKVYNVVNSLYSLAISDSVSF